MGLRSHLKVATNTLYVILEVYPPFCTLRLGGPLGESLPKSLAHEQDSQRRQDPLSGKRTTADMFTWFLQDRGMGGNKVRGRVLYSTSGSVRMQNCHEIRTLSIALPNGDGVKEWRLERHEFCLLISSSTLWEVFLSNYRNRWKPQERQDLWPR